MRVLSFPEDQFPGEGALISELAKKDSTGTSILKECNDSAELVYVRFNEMKDGKEVVDERGRFITKNTKMSYLKIKKELRGQKDIAFITVDNFRKQYTVIVAEPSVKVIPFVGETDAGKFVFLGEAYNDNRRGPLVETKTKICVCAPGILSSRHKEKVMLFFPCEDYDEANALAADLKLTMGGGKILLTSGMLVPEIVPNKQVGLEVEKMNVVVNEHTIFADPFDDVVEVVKRIKSWRDISLWRDVGSGEPFYTREVNELLMYSVCYAKSGRAAFNLILSGLPSTAKTSCLTEYARVFGDEGKVIQAQGATTKGLIPSFGDSLPKPGSLASPGFMKAVDEIFRHVSSQHENQGMNTLTGAIGAYLSKLLPILTRRMQSYPSGSGEDFSVQMTASLIATDNLREDVRVALSNQVEKDPAVLRRFTLVYLNEDDWHKIKTATIVPADDEIHGYIDEIWKKEYGFSVVKMKRFAMWFRREVSHIDADSMRCLSIADDVVSIELRKLIGSSIDLKMEEKINWFSRKLDFVDHVRALVECSALMREVYAADNVLPRNVKVIDEDYATARRIFERIMNDCIFLFNQNLATILLGNDQSPHIGGVKRS